MSSPATPLNRTLYSYWRSSTAYRIRIVLNLKRLDYETVPVNLLNGEHGKQDYLSINPQGRLPTLFDKGEYYTQSMAIAEYLEETYPEPPLLPHQAPDRAYIRALCNIIGCDIHPINNLSVLNYLSNPLGHSDEEKNTWYQYWTIKGLQNLESTIKKAGKDGAYCFGDQVTLADCALIPQLYNARRYNVDMAAFPHLSKIEGNCLTLPAFTAAHPDNQPDAK